MEQGNFGAETERLAARPEGHTTLTRQLVQHFMHGLPSLAIVALLVSWAPFRPFVVSNGIIQSALFALVVIVPALKTGRMSYVDLGWPIGLFLIGLQALVFGDIHSTRTWLIAVMYLCVGGRMSAMGIIGWRHGWLDRELPRYQYQRLRWQRRGLRERVAMIYEVASQGLANMSVLAVPAVVQASMPSAGLSALEGIGFALWLTALAFESVADAQKARFSRRMQQEQRQGEHCAEGLWRYSRHPNYFGEWMVWNAICLTTLPSLMALANSASAWYALLLFATLVYLSFVMYVVLTRYSGAVPAEHYSVKKRPGYAAYQRATNQFFPGPVRGGRQ